MAPAKIIAIATPKKDLFLDFSKSIFPPANLIRSNLYSIISKLARLKNSTKAGQNEQRPYWLRPSGEFLLSF